MACADCPLTQPLLRGEASGVSQRELASGFLGQSRQRTEEAFVTDHRSPRGAVSVRAKV